MQKNDEFEILITDISDQGLGIGRTDGLVWFVKDTVPGDRVLAAATKVKKNYGFARLVQLLSASPDRTEPVCPAARACGGCTLQAMRYEAQLRFKENKVRSDLIRIGGFDLEVMEQSGKADGENGFVFEPIIGMEDPLRYRNKAQFPIGRSRDGRIVTGFYAGRTHSIVECPDCVTGAEENRLILNTVIAWMQEYGVEPYEEEKHRGIVRHVLIRKGIRTGEMMVCLVINAEKLKDAEELAERLTALHFADPGVRVTQVSLSVNRQVTNVIMGDQLINVYGPGYIEDRIRRTDGREISFRISPLAFYQVNSVQMERLYAKAYEYAAPKPGENLWDLYCGTGTLSLYAADLFGCVRGVEIIPEAIENARDNAARNGFGNTEFFVGKAEEVLPAWHEQNPGERIDLIITDPPRKGCDIKCLETILAMQPERIVYVSCDPATLARDLRILADGGYELRKVCPVDQFPFSVHVETVVLMSRAGK